MWSGVGRAGVEDGKLDLSIRAEAKGLLQVNAINNERGSSEQMFVFSDDDFFSFLFLSFPYVLGPCVD